MRITDLFFRGTYERRVTSFVNPNNIPSLPTFLLLLGKKSSGISLLDFFIVPTYVRPRFFSCSTSSNDENQLSAVMLRLDPSICFTSLSTDCVGFENFLKDSSKPNPSESLPV